MVKVFETKIIAVGPEAEEMIRNANMLILFGQGAPEDLAEFCYTIDNKTLLGNIEPGGKIMIDEDEYHITAVGSLVTKNLKNLGHITISFDGEQQASLPGTLHVLGSTSPNIGLGSRVLFMQ
ncbi:PTS glucitol/sorbitol transporter subunit IIA [Streptococcus porcinus]|uniref:PTS system glucitol/sorbitol-specific transporter subunit IIA n=2 Tax=Streptococcus porcinus TaxID=1340 RepID=A0A4V0HF93_STRPO|nr:PTS glucitol/sorbitol transporter subunit IIA [Streptococcus porcinus]EGJ26544.1 putative PTS system protein, glucitol/sorbitol-specific, IIA component [Streptococcus porcinus str. Jelinkova 176]SQG48586.1 PTS system glucitol/sorbitol-specific transporter subunit IIA [Streptococcus porcinus]VTT46838.1 PTS system glucitol/sorbitol-specific transporter subunit IIA [Streptococcus porcinus]VTT47858.1 PTS system glucitol/sorbitol-specific transporter subunit IIA [Streptococcus porcinus]